MNEIEKLRIMYNITQNLQEKQDIAEKINNHIKTIEKQVIVMKSTIDNTTRNMDLLWEQRTALYNILHNQEKIIPVVEEKSKIPHQINMLKQHVNTQTVPEQYPKTTDENISVQLRSNEALVNLTTPNLVQLQSDKAPVNLTTPNTVHTVLIVELDLPHKWLYDYKITQLSKQIKNNRCIVKIDLDSVPQQHIHITEVSGVKNGYVDIYVNIGVNKIYNIRIISDAKLVGLSQRVVALDSRVPTSTLESDSVRVGNDMRNMIALLQPVLDPSQVLLIGLMCGIRTS